MSNVSEHQPEAHNKLSMRLLVNKLIVYHISRPLCLKQSNELKTGTSTQLIHDQKEKELHILIQHQSDQIEQIRQQEINTKRLSTV